MRYDFSRPEERLVAVEALGPQRYNEEMRKHREEGVIDRIGGHKLRTVSTRFGLLYSVGDTGMAFGVLREAEEYARAHPFASLAALTKEYQARLEDLGLPQMSADELLHEDLTVEQRAYVSDFYGRWEAIENKINNLQADIRKLDDGMSPDQVRELAAQIEALEGEAA